MKTTLRTCKKCGWVYVGVSRRFANKSIKEFNAYVKTIPKQDWVDFWGGKLASIDTYEICWCGNHYSNFRKFKKGDCPGGVTMSPIIYENRKRA